MKYLRHNHLTRQIQTEGKCPACDLIRADENIGTLIVVHEHRSWPIAVAELETPPERKE